MHSPGARGSGLGLGLPRRTTPETDRGPVWLNSSEKANDLRHMRLEREAEDCCVFENSLAYLNTVNIT